MFRKRIFSKFYIIVILCSFLIACQGNSNETEDTFAQQPKLPTMDGIDQVRLSDHEAAVWSKGSPSTIFVGTEKPTMDLLLNPTSEPTPTPAPTAAPQSVTLLAVGDNLIHEEVIESGSLQGGGYNYDHLFSKMKERIARADISVINQETILGGTQMGLSGYPTFNSPTQIGDAIAKAGFDVVLQASNHAMDKGKKGIANTLKFWEQYSDITVLGIHNSKKDRDTISIIEKNGIKFAMINATYGLNGITLSSEESYLVDLLDKSRLATQIKKAKKKADIVIVFPHWGTEYTYEADEMQKDWTTFMANQGVDLVIGSHPHTIQPVQWIEGKEGNRMLVYYSLGNYISYQKKAPRMVGEMAEITFTRGKNSVEIAKANVTPIITHYEVSEDYNFGTYLLSEYTKELASKHGVIQKEEGSLFSLEYERQLAKDVLGDWNTLPIK